MNARRAAIGALTTATCLLALLLLAFSLPVPLSRTGEHLSPSLVYLPHGLLTGGSEPVWIDTDAGCGTASAIDCDAVTMNQAACHEVRDEGPHALPACDAVGIGVCRAPIAIPADREPWTLLDVRRDRRTGEPAALGVSPRARSPLRPA